MSRYEAGPPAESSRTLTVVLLALLILTVIGALFGYMLGLRDIDEHKSASGDTPSPGATAGATGKPASARPTPSRKVQNCPDFISDAASLQGAYTPMTLVQYVRLKHDREVWICQEASGGGLWYQGHDKKQKWAEDGEIPKEGENGLLRPGVTVPRDRTYVVMNNQSTYTVTLDGLVVTGPGAFSDESIQLNPPR